MQKKVMLSSIKYIYIYILYNVTYDIIVYYINNLYLYEFCIAFLPIRPSPTS